MRVHVENISSCCKSGDALLSFAALDLITDLKLDTRGAVAETEPYSGDISCFVHTALGA